MSGLDMRTTEQPAVRRCDAHTAYVVRPERHEEGETLHCPRCGGRADVTAIEGHRAFLAPHAVPDRRIR